MNIEFNQIKQIFEVTAKLEQAFRHIRDLSVKYLQFQGNSFPPTYGQSIESNEPYYIPQIPYLPNQSYMSGYGANKERRQPFNGKQINGKNSQHSIISQQQIQKKPLVNGHHKNSKDQQISDKSISKPNQNFDKFNTTPPSTLKPIIPEPPSSAYGIFLSSKKFQIRKQYPQLNNQQLKDIMGEVWRSFSKDEKEPYEQEYLKLKKEYEIKLRQSKGSANNTTKYQQSNVKVVQARKNI